MNEDMFRKLRSEMVVSQIRARGVRDAKVLAAMEKVPRHLFVPEESRYLAYEDFPLPIGKGQTISQPYIVAFMTELLGLKGRERVLEIGTGSGYQAAVLGELAAEVYSIEIVPSLAERAARTLEELGYTNIHTNQGDGFLGWEEAAPFDAVILTCAASEVPPPLIAQLKEGGVLVAPEGEGIQELVILRKRNGRIHKERSLAVRFVPLVRGRTADDQ